jgi:hypothetical protein
MTTGIIEVDKLPFLNHYNLYDIYGLTQIDMEVQYAKKS